MTTSPQALEAHAAPPRSTGPPPIARSRQKVATFRLTSLAAAAIGRNMARALLHRLESQCTPHVAAARKARRRRPLVEQRFFVRRAGERNGDPNRLGEHSFATLSSPRPTLPGDFGWRFLCGHDSLSDSRAHRVATRARENAGGVPHRQPRAKGNWSVPPMSNFGYARPSGSLRACLTSGQI